MRKKSNAAAAAASSFPFNELDTTKRQTRRRLLFDFNAESVSSTVQLLKQEKEKAKQTKLTRLESTVRGEKSYSTFSLSPSVGLMD